MMAPDFGGAMKALFVMGLGAGIFVAAILFTACGWLLRHLSFAWN